MKQTKGFTLIELLLVVAIIGILAAIATPIYTDYTRKSKRSEGKNLLMQAAARQEQFYLNNNQYSLAMGDLGFAANADGTVDTENGHYKVAVRAETAACPIENCFELEAVPQGDQTNDTCDTLTISSDGTKGSTAPTTTVQNCW